MLVADVQAPALTIIGDADVHVKQLSKYHDAGASALDDTAGPVVVAVSGLDEIDTREPTAPGLPYLISYTATDDAGNAAVAQRRVHVEALCPEGERMCFDGPEPYCSLLGGLCGFDDGLKSLSDTPDGIVVAASRKMQGRTRPALVPRGTGDLSVTTSGNLVLEVRVPMNEAYVDPGAVSVDEEDGDLSNAVTSSGAFSIATAQPTPAKTPFVVRYRVEDSAGVAALAERHVHVYDPCTDAGRGALCEGRKFDGGSGCDDGRPELCALLADAVSVQRSTETLNDSEDSIEASLVAASDPPELTLVGPAEVHVPYGVRYTTCKAGVQLDSPCERGVIARNSRGEDRAGDVSLCGVRFVDGGLDGCPPMSAPGSYSLTFSLEASTGRRVTVVRRVVVAPACPVGERSCPGSDSNRCSVDGLCSLDAAAPLDDDEGSSSGVSGASLILRTRGGTMRSAVKIKQHAAYVACSADVRPFPPEDPEETPCEPGAIVVGKGGDATVAVYACPPLECASGSSPSACSGHEFSRKGVQDCVDTHQPVGTAFVLQFVAYDVVQGNVLRIERTVEFIRPCSSNEHSCERDGTWTCEPVPCGFALGLKLHMASRAVYGPTLLLVGDPVMQRAYGAEFGDGDRPLTKCSYVAQARATVPGGGVACGAYAGEGYDDISSRIRVVALDSRCEVNTAYRGRCAPGTYRFAFFVTDDEGLLIENANPPTKTLVVSSVYEVKGSIRIVDASFDDHASADVESQRLWLVERGDIAASIAAGFAAQGDPAHDVALEYIAPAPRADGTFGLEVAFVARVHKQASGALASAGADVLSVKTRRAFQAVVVEPFYVEQFEVNETTPLANATEDAVWNLEGQALVLDRRVDEASARVELTRAVSTDAFRAEQASAAAVEKSLASTFEAGLAIAKMGQANASSQADTALKAQSAPSNATNSTATLNVTYGLGELKGPDFGLFPSAAAREITDALATGLNGSAAAAALHACGRSSSRGDNMYAFDVSSPAIDPSRPPTQQARRRRRVAAPSSVRAVLASNSSRALSAGRKLLARSKSSAKKQKSGTDALDLLDKEAVNVDDISGYSLFAVEKYVQFQQRTYLDKAKLIGASKTAGSVVIGGVLVSQRRYRAPATCIGLEGFASDPTSYLFGFGGSNTGRSRYKHLFSNICERARLIAEQTRTTPDRSAFPFPPFGRDPSFYPQSALFDPVVEGHEHLFYHESEMRFATNYSAGIPYGFFPSTYQEVFPSKDNDYEYDYEAFRAKKPVERAATCSRFGAVPAPPAPGALEGIFEVYLDNALRANRALRAVRYLQDGGFLDGNTKSVEVAMILRDNNRRISSRARVSFAVKRSGVIEAATEVATMPDFSVWAMGFAGVWVVYVLYELVTDVKAAARHFRKFRAIDHASARMQSMDERRRIEYAKRKVGKFRSGTASTFWRAMFGTKQKKAPALRDMRTHRRHRIRFRVHFVYSIMRCVDIVLVAMLVLVHSDSREVTRQIDYNANFFPFYDGDNAARARPFLLKRDTPFELSPPGAPEGSNRYLLASDGGPYACVYRSIAAHLQRGIRYRDLAKSLAVISVLARVLEIYMHGYFAKQLRPILQTLSHFFVLAGSCIFLIAVFAGGLGLAAHHLIGDTSEAFSSVGKSLESALSYIFGDIAMLGREVLFGGSKMHTDAYTLAAGLIFVLYPVIALLLLFQFLLAILIDEFSAAKDEAKLLGEAVTDMGSEFVAALWEQLLKVAIYLTNAIERTCALGACKTTRKKGGQPPMLQPMPSPSKRNANDNSFFYQGLRKNMPSMRDLTAVRARLRQLASIHLWTTRRRANPGGGGRTRSRRIW